MTELSILNDGWAAWKNNPQKLVEAISEGMIADIVDSYGVRDGNSFYANQLTVHPSHHADDPRVYVARYNSFEALEPETAYEVLTMLKKKDTHGA